MSVIDELSPYIRAYPKAFRMARSRFGLTNEKLSGRSGVPPTVRNAQSGNGGVTIVQAAALARAGSVHRRDVRCSQAGGGQQRAELEQRIRALELELADRNGEIRSLRDSNDTLRSRTGATYPIRLSPSVRFCSLL